MGRTTKATGLDAGRDRYHHGNLREALLDAAADLIARDGVTGFSLNAAARAAGVSTAAPYRHFASREALIGAVVERGWIRFSAELDRVVAQHPDPLARLTALGRAYIDFAVSQPAVFRLFFDERGREPTRDAGLATFATLLDCVAQARASGRLPVELSDVDIAHAAWALVHGLAHLCLDGALTVTNPDVGPEETIAAAMAVLGTSLRAAAG
jgi:AcrR family transcriptional regulator